jgi:hypothetical protein
VRRRCGAGEDARWRRGEGEHVPAAEAGRRPRGRVLMDR